MSTGRGAYGMHQDPFNDPFFANPFSMMNQMMGQMNQMMNSMFAADPFFAGGGPHQQQHQQASRQRLPSTVIEEVHDDRPVTGSSSQPIVEEPDDDPVHAHARRQQQAAGNSGHRHQPQQVSMPGLFGNLGSTGGGPVYAYSSSSIMTNQNGVTYQKSTTARMGPGGVKEVQSTERDGRTGKESITISRALGDKARTITRTRDASGRETAQDMLNGIGQDEAHRFDDEWRRTAEQNLLGGRAALGAAQPRRPAQPQLQYQPHATGSYAPAPHQPANQPGYQAGSYASAQPAMNSYRSGAYEHEPLGRSRTVGRYV